MTKRNDPHGAEALADAIADAFAAHANARKAREMAAYMKTTMPFYGVQKLRA
ncbi:MAG: DNA alkylation repair protein [Deltaproteobacteria bacterium]|nr:DNA alkylation repair protein [Deltaproteobacteria bacterium]